MVGNFKLIIIIIIFITLNSCYKKENFSLEGAKIVNSHIEVLLDSIEFFDWTKIPISAEFKNETRKKFNYELIDSVGFDVNIYPLFNKNLKKHYDNIFTNSNIIKLKLNPTILSRFKKKNLTLSKKKSNDIYVLSIIFSNLIISVDGTFASLVVTKSCGISMTKDIYFFEKIDSVWVFKEKINIVIG